MEMNMSAVLDDEDQLRLELATLMNGSNWSHWAQLAQQALSARAH